MMIAEHLHLDVTRVQRVFFNQNPIVAERGLRLTATTRQSLGERLGHIHSAHALAASAGHGFDEDRIADGRGLALEPLRRLIFSQITRRDRHTSFHHSSLRGVLQAHGADRCRRRSDPDQPCLEH